MASRSCLRLIRVAWVLSGLGFWLPAAQAANLEERISPLVEAHSGQVAVTIRHLKSGETFAWQADRVMPTASLIKLPLMVAAYDAIHAGRIRADEMLTLQEEDKVPGSGILTPHFSEGMQLSLRDAIRLMIVYSDNTATNLVIDRVGLDSTARLMASLGLRETRLNSKVYRRDSSIDPERSRTYGLGSTTAAEMLTLLERLDRGELVDPDACLAMREHLAACDDKVKFRRLLPRARILHKTGSVNAVRCDAGLIESPAGTIAICVLTSENTDESWGMENDAEILCARIAKEAYEYFNPKIHSPISDDGPLKEGAAGWLVQGLQRTLNARMTPSPRLTVDGEFGPATEEAVMRFQESHDLPPTGQVSPETWATLGPIIEDSEDAASDHDETPTRAPADALAGPPLVSCRAWAIADAATGELLWGNAADRPLDNASTTKIMTAYVVAKYAEEHPEVLEEIVEFSARADRTVGSTAGIRTGETTTVRDLLYGLLLPSGNDASVALAEHFGQRVGSGGETPTKLAPEEQFIQEMNAQAQALGMVATVYRNPHGLTAEGHQSSAHDLVRLAHRALDLSLLSEIVNTPRYECLINGPGGYQRRVSWRNTNRLLAIEGFDGIKTGTTSRAGACLVSRGTRDGRTLIMAVLGSASSESRYVDSRNLYRWAWSELGHRDER